MTMIRASALLLPLLLTIEAASWGQEPTRPARAPDPPEVRISPALYFREITLDLVDGTRLRGRLLGVSPDIVRFRTDGGDRDVPLRDVRRAVVRTEKGPLASKGAVPGAIIGLYIGNGLSTKVYETPGFYLDSGGDYHHTFGLWNFLAQVFYAGAGGALGWLAFSGSSARTFVLSWDGGSDGVAREEFVKFVTAGRVEPRFHVLVLGGQVLWRTTPRLEDGLAGSGLTPSPYQYSSMFSYLRAVQVTRTFRSRFHAGLRVSFPGEPMTWAHGEGISLREEFQATAGHAVVSISPLSMKPGRPFSWTAGLGAGVAWVRLKRTLYDDSGPMQGDDITVETSGPRPSAVAFTTLELRVSQMFSLGVAADYTFLGSAEAPGLADYGIATQKVGLGNGSVGFVLGFHF
jgi:hypothetical protein